MSRASGIPKAEIARIIRQHGIGNALAMASCSCGTPRRREALESLFEFKSLYAAIAEADGRQGYRIDSPESAKAYFTNYFADKREREILAAAFLDGSGEVIETKEMSRGTLTMSVLSPRDIIKEALFLKAERVVLAHNHPSGSAELSEGDDLVTEGMAQAAKAAGIKFADHVVVGDEAVSYYEMGAMGSQAGYGRRACAPRANPEDSQYRRDCERAAEIMAAAAGIPERRTLDFIESHGASMLPGYAEYLCETSEQREKAAALFEFARAYAEIKAGERRETKTLSSDEAAGQHFADWFAKNRGEGCAAAYLSASFGHIATIPLKEADGKPYSAEDVIRDALRHNAVSVLIAHSDGTDEIGAMAAASELKAKATALKINIADVIAFDCAAGERRDAYKTAKNMDAYRNEIRDMRQKSAAGGGSGSIPTERATRAR